MARQTLTKQTISRAGVILTNASVIAADGAQFIFDSATRTMLRATNSGGASANVKLRIATTVDGQAVTGNGRIVAVANDSVPVLIGPFIADYKQTDGYVYIDTDAPVSIAVVNLPSA